MWNNKIPSKGKRVLMLAPDIAIDRRILIEAETLIDDGYEVYLLAGWDGKSDNFFEIEGRVKIERIKFEGIDQRLTIVYKIQSRLINILNKQSTRINNLLAKLSNSIQDKQIHFINILNKQSTRINNLLRALARLINKEQKNITNIINNLNKKINDVIDLKLINFEPTYTLIINYQFLVQVFLVLLLIKSYQLVIIILLKVKKIGINLIGKSINLSRRIFQKLISILLKVKNICISLIGKSINLSSRICQKLISILLKLKNIGINLIGKSINFIVSLINKIFGVITSLNSYENLLFDRGLFYRPDLIHVHDLPMLKAGVKLKQKLNVPLIYDMHEFYPEQDCLTPLQQKKLRNTESKNIKYTDVRITVNPMLADEISKTYNNTDIKVIQNAMIIDPDFHNRQYDKFREEYSIKKDEIILLYQGWISPDRNLQNLVKGLAQVEKPIKLVFMGYGGFKEELESISRNIHIKDKVVFVPSKTQAELLSYTASADIGIIPYPSKLDPNTKYASPNKLYEFIAARLPIICNNLPFVKTLVEDNCFGMSFEMNSPEAFANAINNFPYNQLNEFRKNIELKGVNFLWESEAPKLLEIYNKYNSIY